jgi:hypothetical protein
VGVKELPFVVMVQRSSRSKPECSAIYDGNGEVLESIDLDAPAPPPASEE